MRRFLTIPHLAQLLLPLTRTPNWWALVEKRIAARALTREADDDDADVACDEMNRIDALIVSLAACTLDGTRLKASICRDVRGDAELAWPMLCSLVADLQRVPLDDQATLPAIFAELATPLPPPPTFWHRGVSGAWPECWRRPMRQ